MDYEEYEKIEVKYGAESEEAKEAYLQLMVTELELITKEVVFDDWGWATITLKDYITLSGEQLLMWVDILDKAKLLMFRVKGNEIRMRTW